MKNFRSWKISDSFLFDNMLSIDVKFLRARYFLNLIFCCELDITKFVISAAIPWWKRRESSAFIH